MRKNRKEPMIAKNGRCIGNYPGTSAADKEKPLTLIAMGMSNTQGYQHQPIQLHILACQVL